MISTRISKSLAALAVGVATLLAAGLAPAQSTAPAAAPAAVVVGGKPFVTEPRHEITDLPDAPVTPKTPADLKAIQTRVEAVVRQALPATVGILMPDGQGSGVIVSKDGFVLTAGHVSGKPGSNVEIVLSNGVVVQGKAMGANTQIDSGMVKITTPGEYPFMPVGTVSETLRGASRMKVAVGQWVVAMGHPGGYQQSRPPVARLGRILMVQKNRSGLVTAVATDCPLINGDSGGPVFDLDGRVIGINSRIGISLSQNLHVPIDTFTDTWDRLAKGEQWPAGGFFVRRSDRGGAGGLVPPDSVALTPRLGVKPEEHAKGVLIALVYAGSSAEAAGLKQGDVVMRFDGQLVKTTDELTALVQQHKPGDTVMLDVLRSAETKRVTVKLGAE